MKTRKASISKGFSNYSFSCISKEALSTTRLQGQGASLVKSHSYNLKRNKLPKGVNNTTESEFSGQSSFKDKDLLTVPKLNSQIMMKQKSPKRIALEIPLG